MNGISGRNRPGIPYWRYSNDWNYDVFPGHDPTAVSAYINMMKVQDFFSDVLERNSYNNRGGNIRVTIHDPFDINNAGWFLRTSVAAFTDASEGRRSHAASLDLAGHEFAHGLINYYGLPYFDYSGGSVITRGISEGYADVLGELTEMIVMGSRSWTIGENSFPSGGRMRNLRARFRLYDPNYWSVVNSTAVDAPGHGLATILGHSLFRMYAGGINDPTRLARLWYESLRVGTLDGSTTFYDVRWNVVMAARSLGFTQSEMRIIDEAFDEVNIISMSISGRIIEGAITPGQTTRPITVTLTLPNGREVVQTTNACGSFRFDNLNSDTVYHLRFEHGMIEPYSRIIYLGFESRDNLLISLTPRAGTATVTFELHHNDTSYGDMELADTWQITAAIGSVITEPPPGPRPTWRVEPSSLRVSALGDNVIRIIGDFS